MLKIFNGSFFVCTFWKTFSVFLLKSIFIISHKINFNLFFSIFENLRYLKLYLLISSVFYRWVEIYLKLIQFSWKENKYYEIPKCLILGFMCAINISMIICKMSKSSKDTAHSAGHSLKCGGTYGVQGHTRNWPSGTPGRGGGVRKTYKTKKKKRQVRNIYWLNFWILED